MTQTKNSPDSFAPIEEAAHDCGCGHDHNHGSHDHGEHGHHEHDHGDSCGCGHDHGEHDHHEHDHGDSCGCGHDHGEHDHHEHDHGDSCGCGHDHGEHDHGEHDHGEHDHHEHDHHEHDHHEHDHHEHDHHEHDHGDSCGCGHDHGEHDHHVAGHPSDCECELCHPHAEYCDVCGESLASCTCRMPDDGMQKRVYILENLGCANCAAKMERLIKELPEVRYANITYATKQLRLSAPDHEKLLPEIRRICASIESDVKVVPRGATPGITKTKTYILQNLGCANCASKMERQINNLEGVTSATITYTTKQLRVTAKSPERCLPEIQRICAGIEAGVVVVEKDTSPKSDDTLQAASARSGAKKRSPLAERLPLLQIITGAALFIIGEIAEHMGAGLAVLLPVYIVAYLILGTKILLNAARTIAGGHLFDENFLMSIATLGAFVIGEYPEAVGIMLFYRVGEYFEDRAVEKSRSQIMDAVDMRPETVNLLIGDDVTVIDACDAQVGDILLVRPGERIPLDGVIIDGDSRVDTSPITGEPVPVHVGYGSEVVSGGINTSGQLKMRVEKLLEESMVTKILNSVENAAASKPKIDRFIMRFARVYTPIVVFGAIAIAIFPPLFGGDWRYWVYTALTFLVMSCPCALVLSVPLAFFSGIGAGSKLGILFKGGVSLEALKDVQAVVMDKTGTLTEGNFIVQQTNVYKQRCTPDELLALCADCESFSTHPVGSSILLAARSRGLDVKTPDNVEELAGYGIKADINGGVALCGNMKLMEMFGVAVPADESGGYGAEVFAALNGEYLGKITISDTVKADAKSAVSQLKAQGLSTVMLTGDTLSSAQAVAAQTGVDEVRAKLLPQDKLNELGRIRNRYGSVMFVGDGINDAPVLAGADVGAAMGSGADAAIEAADVVFMSSTMEAIPQSIKIAKSACRIAMQNVVFAIAVKVIVMILGLFGYASMWAAVFADTGVAMLCVLNSVRILRIGKMKAKSAASSQLVPQTQPAEQ